MEDLEILWGGTLVGRLTNTELETIMFGGPSKLEGDFVCAPGAVPAEFQRRLEAHELLELTTADSETRMVIYGRPGGRAKVAWWTEPPAGNATDRKAE